MRRSYESPLPLQEGWSSLQTHSRARRDTHRGLALVSGRLGNLHARTALRACSKNLQIAPNCGSWARACVVVEQQPKLTPPRGATKGFLALSCLTRHDTRVFPNLRYKRGPAQVVGVNYRGTNCSAGNAWKTKLVRKVGFEPTRLAAPPPQDGASASSATSARRNARI